MVSLAGFQRIVLWYFCSVCTKTYNCLKCLCTLNELLAERVQIAQLWWGLVLIQAIENTSAWHLVGIQLHAAMLAHPQGVHACIWVMHCNIPLYALPHAGVELLFAVLQARDTASLVQALTTAACKLRVIIELLLQSGNDPCMLHEKLGFKVGKTRHSNGSIFTFNYLVILENVSTALHICEIHQLLKVGRGESSINVRNALVVLSNTIEVRKEGSQAWIVDCCRPDFFSAHYHTYRRHKKLGDPLTAGQVPPHGFHHQCSSPQGGSVRGEHWGSLCPVHSNHHAAHSLAVGIVTLFCKWRQCLPQMAA